LFHNNCENYGILLDYVSVSVQSDLILPELQQHMFQRWTGMHTSSELWTS